MGVVEAKLVLNNDELPPSPSWNSLDVVLADVARLEVGEKPGNGVDAPGIAVAQANVGVDPDPRSYKKGVEEAEKEVPMQFPQRSEAPDCAFYMKTGACKFGSACKFNHPPKRRKPRVRANKGAENVQAAREEHKSNGSKMMTQGARRDDNVEKQTSSRRLQQEDCKFQKNAIRKQIPPFKKFEQTEKKAAQMERHRLRSEQDDSKFQNNAVGKQIPPFKKFVQIEKKADEVERNCSTSEKEDSKFQNNAVGKQIPPFKKFVQIEKKADVVERNSSTSEKEDSKFQNNAVGKQIPPFKKFVQIEKKADVVERNSSTLEKEDSKFQNNAVGKQIPPFKKFVQIEKKADEVERNCSTSDKEDSKFQNNAVGKQIPPFKKFVQIEKKADEVERNCSTSEKEDSKLQKNAIRKQIPPFKKFEQTEKKTDKEEKQCSMLEQEDSKATEKMSKEAISGNVGMAECKFYKTSGRCKYGKSCKYIHSLKKIEVASPALNFLGLPIRPGEKECPCYMHTGNCKYAANCKYHHPEPTVATLEQGALPVFQIGGSEQQIPFGASSLPVTPSPTQGAFYVPTPLTAASPAYFPESHLHPQGLLFPSNSECNGYQMHTKRPGETEYQYHPKISHLNA